ncbi:MAG: hypothetical protein FJ135_08685 [Deltaproteobacteria bacterium]|nr:hypothetical protein [Deltaproteobacteria bacterium]
MNVSIILYLTFPNPVWLENEKRGYSNRQVPAALRFYGLAEAELAPAGSLLWSIFQRSAYSRQLKK